MKQKNQPKKKLLTYQHKNHKVYLKIRSDLITETNLTKVLKTTNKILLSFGNNYLITIEYLPFCLFKEHRQKPNIKVQRSPNNSYLKLPECKKCILNKYCYGVPASLTNVLKKVIKPINDKPDEIVIEITKRCKQHCIMCFAKSKTINRHEPTISKIKEIMQEMQGLRIKAIRFTGGEPFERNDILKILQLAKKEKFYVILNTNATSLVMNKIKILENLVDNILVSLHGYNQKTDAQVTGNGNLFKEKLRNIYRLTHSKIPIVRIGSVMTQTLIYNHAKYFKILTSLGAKNWEVYRPMLSATSIKTHSNFDISKNEIQKCIDFLYKINLKGINAKIANPVPFCIIDNEDKARLTLVGAHADDGHSRLIYDTQGHFKPNYFLNVKLGQTIDESLNHNFLKKIKSLDYLSTKCNRCSFLWHCKGGSRFLAFQKHKSYFKPDPLMKNLDI